MNVPIAFLFANALTSFTGRFVSIYLHHCISMLSFMASIYFATISGLY